MQYYIQLILNFKRLDYTVILLSFSILSHSIILYYILCYIQLHYYHNTQLYCTIYRTAFNYTITTILNYTVLYSVLQSTAQHYNHYYILLWNSVQKMAVSVVWEYSGGGWWPAGEIGRAHV